MTALLTTLRAIVSHRLGDSAAVETEAVAGKTVLVVRVEKPGVPKVRELRKELYAAIREAGNEGVTVRVEQSAA